MNRTLPASRAQDVALQLVGLQSTWRVVRECSHEGAQMRAHQPRPTRQRPSVRLPPRFPDLRGHRRIGPQSRGRAEAGRPSGGIVSAPRVGMGKGQVILPYTPQEDHLCIASCIAASGRAPYRAPAITAFRKASLVQELADQLGLITLEPARFMPSRERWCPGCCGTRRSDGSPSWTTVPPAV